MATGESAWPTGCAWPDGKAATTHELQTTILQAEAPTTGYFRSIAATGVMTAKPHEQ